MKIPIFLMLMALLYGPTRCNGDGERVGGWIALPRESVFVISFFPLLLLLVLIPFCSPLANNAVAVYTNWMSVPVPLP